MYIPAHFREENLCELHALIQRFSFATLITCENGLPFATPLPVLLDANAGPYGTLRAHLARANPQWKHFGEEREALVVFQGPHAYVSPSWYETHPSVPTWNYAAAHAYGVPRLLEEEALPALLQEMVAFYESAFERPWSFDLPTDYTQKMLRGIVGFEIEITRLEGKFKLSQNRSQTDQERVATMLEQSGDSLSVETAKMMRRHNTGRV